MTGRDSALLKVRVKVAVDGLSLRTQVYFTGPGPSALMRPVKCTRAGLQLPVMTGGMIQSGFDGKGREQQGQHRALDLQHFIQLQEFLNVRMTAFCQVGDRAKVDHASVEKEHHAVRHFVHQIEIVRHHHAGEL